MPMKIRLPEYKWQTFFVTGIANIITALSISSINIAMPIMAEEFGVSMTAISRLSLVFAVITSCTVLIFGRIADMFGYKRQFVAGFLFFALSSLLLPLLSHGLAGAVFFRCLQAVGSAMLVSITQALCNRTFPANERGKALGVNAVFVSLGLALGPSVGGLLLSYFSWRAVFIINAPIGLLGAIIAIIVLKKDELSPASLRDMDWLGSLLFAVSIGLITIVINFSTEWGFSSLRFIGCIAVGVFLLLLFILRESRIDKPLMNLTLFRKRTFSCANIASFCSYFLQQMNLFLVPFFLINILLMTSSHSGFIMLAMPLTMMLLSPFGGRLTDRYGSRGPALFGLCFLAAGGVLMSAMTDVTPAILVIVGMFLFGAGNAFSVVAINTAIFSAVPREQSGMASGMVATVRNLGQAMGVAFAATIMALRQSQYLARAAGEGLEVIDGRVFYMLAQRDTYYFSLFIIAVAVVCMLVIPGRAAKEVSH